MKLYLVQHGDACAKEIDPERPLSHSGRSDVERLATLLGRSGVRVERVLHSGKLRAEQTAQCLAATLAPGVALESVAGINPNDDPAAFEWRSGDGDQGTLIVGHLPFMGKLVAHLVSGDVNRPVVAFRPGTIVCLERDGGSHWQVSWMIRPELLC